MLPTSPIYHVTHRDRGYTELLGEHWRGHNTLLIAPSYLSNLFFGQFCSGSVFASGLAAFCHSIVDVVSIGPEKEMRGIYARGIVAIGAVVQYLQSFRDRPIVNLPRRAVGHDLLSALRDVSVPFRVRVSSPQPTPVRAQGLVNLCPEALFKRGGILRASIDHSGSTGTRRAFTSTESPSSRHFNMGPMEAKRHSAHFANPVELLRTASQRAVVGTALHAGRLIEKVSTAITTRIQCWGILGVHSTVLSSVSRTGWFQPRRCISRASIIPETLDFMGFWATGGEL